MKQRIILITFFFLSALFLNAQKNLQLGTGLQNSMVLQQGKPTIFWGTAPEGAIVKIAADWSKKIIGTKADANNKWSVKVDIPKIAANDYTAHTIEVSADQESIKLTDVLIGEVWLCSGQSNMDMELKPFLPWLQGVVDYEKEIAAADYPQIRLLDIKSDFKNKPAETCKGEWKICTPDNAKDFSGVAYYFGRELLNRLHVPVGLITSSIGATTCQAWTSRETLAADPDLNKILYKDDTSAAAKEILDSIVTFEKVARPTLLYNAMIYPLRNISLKGFLWYQGESNKDDQAIYAKLCGGMISNWRWLFNQGDLPFYFVQVAPYTWQLNDTTAYEYARFRDAQKDVLKVKNTGMAVTMDIADPADIHPRNKKDVGIRLALNAFAQTYGLKNIQNKGPEYKSFTADGDMLKVAFDKSTIGSGLSTNDNAAPRHFYIAGEDKQFYYADAKIVNNEVWLTCDKVQHPVAVRYAYTNYPVTNFGNKDGLPCVPFRTDNW
jgi:sialate O-acetylesterase